MSVYRTEQKKLILETLKNNKDRAFSIEEIIELMQDKEIGKSTIYRLISEFVKDGLVRRFLKENSKKVVYQFLSDVSCHKHLHLKCVDCGKIIHVDDDLTNKILDTVNKEDLFSIDASTTVLYGKCKECKNAKKK